MFFNIFILKSVGLTCAGALLLATTLSGCSSRAPIQTSSTPARTAFVDVAKRQLGIQYRYGGRSPRTGFDCSGLVYYSLQRTGVSAPRTTREQYRQARPVSRSALRPGDLVFFRVYGNNVSHVGIYLGNGRFIHAPSTGKKVSIARLSDAYWKRRFAGGGRI